MRINLGTFDDVRTLIRSRLLSSEFHVLDDLVKRHVAADIWQTWYVSLPSPDDIAASWGVTNSLMACWEGISIDDLDRVAQENEQGTSTVQRMSDILQSYLDTPPWEDPTPMLVISRTGGYCGAAAILDSTTVRKQLEKAFPTGSAFILPSSIHEVIAINSEHDPKELAAMVQAINRSEVAEADRLSDHVYSYDIATGTITVAA